MKTLLDGLLPRIFPGMLFLCIDYEGKDDLHKNFPKLMKSWGGGRRPLRRLSGDGAQ